MGTILEFNNRPFERTGQNAKAGEIVFFTGVRYERQNLTKTGTGKKSESGPKESGSGRKKPRLTRNRKQDN